MLDLDDSEARRLLHLAADTIDVAPAGPVAVPPHRPWWPGLVAAAAVAVAATGLAVGFRSDEPPVPAPAPSTPVVDRLPAQPPSVFGYDTYDAVQMLEALGYEVSTELVPSCDTYGRAVGTTPGPDAGQVTVLRGSGDDTAFCARSPEDPARADAWELIDLVGGRDSRLDLAPTVRVYDATTGRRGPRSPRPAWPRGRRSSRLSPCPPAPTRACPHDAPSTTPAAAAPRPCADGRDCR